MAGLMCPMEQPAVVNTATPNISNASPPRVKIDERRETRKGRGEIREEGDKRGGRREKRDEKRVTREGRRVRL